METESTMGMGSTIGMESTMGMRFTIGIGYMVLLYLAVSLGPGVIHHSTLVKNQQKRTH